jgi:multicomponent Na+:H+ antiporter subunit E
VRNARRIVLLVALWLLAWGDLSAANVLSGIVVAAVLLAVFPPQRRGDGSVRLRPGGALRLAGYVARQLMLSNLTMSREILRLRPRTQPGVLAHRLDHPSEEVVTVMTSVIALSPGTMTVDVSPDSSIVFVHFFRLTDLDGARADLSRLERLVHAALTPEADPSDARSSR